MTTTPVGLVLGSTLHPARLAATARVAEQAGFAELWLSEDYFMTGGIAGAGIVLGATEHIPVGLGVVSAVTRHPGLLGMELATLLHAHPGRLRPAIGLGVPTWLRQMGVMPSSPLTAVRDQVASLRRLLGGERLDAATTSFHFDAVELSYPLPHPPPIGLGVVGPRMLELSGEIADETVLSVLASPEYVAWACERIGAGARRAGRSTDDHRVTAFALYAVDDDGDRARALARESVAFYLHAGGPNAITDSYGISDELDRMIAGGGLDAVIEEMPDAWVDDLAIAGTPRQCAAAVQRLLDAGADTVGLFPMQSERTVEVAQLSADTVLARLG